MYDVDTPADLAEHFLDEDAYWPDDTPRPDEEDVRVHPQGQVYVDVSGVDGRMALHVIRLTERANLRAEVDTGDTVSIFDSRPTCEEDDCYAEAQGGSTRGNLCAGHAKEAKTERMKSGLPPQPGKDY